MIARSEYGAKCPHCTRLNPAATLAVGGGVQECIHCKRSFTYWIEKLPFFCTGDDRPAACACEVCTGKVTPIAEVEPCSNPQCDQVDNCTACGKREDPAT